MPDPRREAMREAQQLARRRMRQVRPAVIPNRNGPRGPIIKLDPRERTGFPRRMIAKGANPRNPMPARPAGYFGGGTAGMARRRAYQAQRTAMHAARRRQM